MAATSAARGSLWTTKNDEIGAASSQSRIDSGTSTRRVHDSSTDAVWSARSRSPAPSRWAMSGTATAARMPPAAISNITFGMALTLW